MDTQQHRRRDRRFGLLCEQRVPLGLHSLDLLEQQFEPIEFSTNLGFEMLRQAPAIASPKRIQSRTPIEFKKNTPVVSISGDGGFLSVVAGPQIKSFADLKGRTLSVDAMTNGLAFVLRELVNRGGLSESDVTYVRAGGTPNRYRELVAGKHDATLLRTPFELLARSRGLNVLATAESLGAYQGTVGAVRKSWASAHAAAMVGFLRAYRAGVEWVCDPANREIAEALLVANIRDMTPALARQSYDLLVAANGGLYRDLRLNPQGMQTVLALRTKYGEPRKTLDDASRYIDTTWYTKAFGAP